MVKSVLYPAIIAATLAVAGHASATFVIDPNPNGEKLFLNSAKDASSSTGNVGVQNTGPVVDISVIGNSDFANGFATIKPVKDGTLTSLTFTPADPLGYSDFSFRGQTLVADQTIDVTVQDDQGGAPQTFSFMIAQPNADFTRIGIISLDRETIKTVTVTDATGFKEFKQIEFSPAVIPEPATWALMLIGVGAMGGVLRRRARGSVAAT